jgi:Putative MetA-pathway of phenol degradation
MKFICLLLFTVTVFYCNNTIGQGCIAVRNISGFGQYNLLDNAYVDSKWQLNINTRYFKSYMDYRGTTNLETPPANQAIVKSYSMDISIARILDKGWSLNFSMPITQNSRQASLEHGGPNTTRHTTHSFGVGDMRFEVYKWIRIPEPTQKWNVQVGLGIKLPTGDYEYEDYFYRNDTTRVLAPVNPSIQLGDGGTGIITEINAYYFLNKTFSFYGNYYRMYNPRGQNGVSTTGGRVPTSAQIKSGSVETSVADQYSARAGMTVNINKIGLSIGIRDEGIPVYDAFGTSEGTRRAGHNTSIEPGIIYRFKATSVYAYVPVFIDHEVKQNVPDKKVSEMTGVYVSSPGGSGDYMVFLGVQFRF